MTSIADVSAEAWGELPSTCISDALDALGISGAVAGVRPLWGSAVRLVGRAVTVRLSVAGETKSFRHLGVDAIESANPGDVLVIDNAGRENVSCFGGVLATAAKLKGIAGVVADGACRDIEDYVALQLPVFARGAAVATARGRLMECGTNELVQCGGIQVRAGDLVIADMSGAVIVPSERCGEVLPVARAIAERERLMIQDLRLGVTIAQVDRKYGYERMLETVRGKAS